MKNGLLVCAGEGVQKNIGDYIQSLAQEQFYDHIDCLVERETINSFSSTQKVKLIMNAWWMWHPDNFPPSEAIDPLFVSFHLVPSISKELLTPKVVEYLKKYEPIGARDTGTRDLLEKYGIKSYFSGCLTLTLGLKYKSEVHDGSIIFVDPYYEIGCIKSENKYLRLLSASWLLLKHFTKVIKLKKVFACEFESPLSYHHMRWLDEYLMCASFYETYRKSFSDEVLLNAEYILHTVEQKDFNGDEDKLDYSRKLMYKYAHAKYVVTSRIHCGLPCLGVETPVLFVTSDKLEGNSVRSSGRFGGLIDLFHVLRWTSQGVTPHNDSAKEIFKSRLSSKSVFTNKEDYKKLRDQMIAKVKEFVTSDQGKN